MTSERTRIEIAIQRLRPLFANRQRLRRAQRTLRPAGFSADPVADAANLALEERKSAARCRREFAEVSADIREQVRWCLMEDLTIGEVETLEEFAERLLPDIAAATAGDAAALARVQTVDQRLNGIEIDKLRQILPIVDAVALGEYVPTQADIDDQIGVVRRWRDELDRAQRNQVPEPVLRRLRDTVGRQEEALDRVRTAADRLAEA